MRRFLGLVKNEYIKNFRLVSVRIMLIIVVLAAIGIPAFIKVIDHISNSYSYSISATVEFEQELFHYKETAESLDDKEYYKLLEHLSDIGVESIYDWRYIAMKDIFNNGWNNTATEARYDEEYLEYIAHLEAEEEGYTPEEAEEMLTAKLVDKFMAFLSSEDYTMPLDIVDKNDMTAWYNYLIEKENAAKPSDKSDPDYELETKLCDLEIETLTYLRDNEIYYCDRNYNPFWLKEDAPEYYDEHFYKAFELLQSRKTIVLYECGQESASNYKRAINKLAIDDYINDNDITYNVANNAGGSLEEIETIDTWSVFYLTSFAISFVGLLVIVISAMSVSSEFSNGTIKFLLINPVKRWKILMSKYFTVISIGYIMIAVMFVLSMITSAVLFDPSLITAKYITASGGEVIVTSGIIFMIKTYLMSSVEVVVMSTMAFAISVLMKSSAFAIGISMLGMFSGNTLVLLLSQFHQDWARYLIFANLDLASISRGQGTFMYQTVGSALIVIAVHMVLMLMIAWDGFTRREV